MGCLRYCVQGVYEVPAHLDLSNNRLTAMPAATVKKPHIKRLDLQHNSIAFVPDTIDRLTCLTHIDLSHNSLDELPAQVSMRGVCASWDLWCSLSACPHFDVVQQQQ